jgi:drug/metabolite transporter (DMT)-like permease
MAKLRIRHYLGFALLCVIWSTTWLAIRVLVKYVPPLHGAAIRFVIAAICLAVYMGIRRVPLRATAREWRTMLALSVIMVTIPYGLTFWAEQFVASSMTAVIYSSLPLFVALLTPFYLHHQVPRRAVYAMLIGLGGIALLFGADLSTAPRQLLGGAAVLGGVLFAAWGAVLAKRDALHVDPALNTVVQFLVGALPLFGASAVLEHGQPSAWNRAAIIALLFLAIFGSAVAFTTYYWLLKAMPAYQLSSTNFITPIAAMAEGAVFLQEPIPLTMLVAVVVVLGAVWVVLRAETHGSEFISIRESGD